MNPEIPIHAVPARKRSKKVILLVLAILLAVAAIVGTIVWQHVRPYSPYKFRPNKWEEPYSKNIPLDEMNFGEYGYYFRIYASGAYPDMVNTVQLSCDVRYYAKPGDKEPVLTLQKGTTVVIALPADEGVGIRCWPDYQKGWRYGTPFPVEGSTEDTAERQMYYVRTKDLVKVAEVFADTNWRYFKGDFLTKHAAAKRLVLSIDVSLYQDGCFCSPDL